MEAPAKVKLIGFHSTKRKNKGIKDKSGQGIGSEGRDILKVGEEDEKGLVLNHNNQQVLPEGKNSHRVPVKTYSDHLGSPNK